MCQSQSKGGKKEWKERDKIAIHISIHDVSTDRSKKKINKRKKEEKMRLSVLLGISPKEKIRAEERKIINEIQGGQVGMIIINTLTVIKRENPKDLERCQFQKAKRNNKKTFRIRIDETDLKGFHSLKLVGGVVKNPRAESN